jgi:endonuclease/exonuclease/phosphatase (EEP) superfamily protein YafD
MNRYGIPQSTDIVANPAQARAVIETQSRTGRCHPGCVPWRSLIAWLLVLPLTGWVVLRAFGLEEGWPMVPLLAYTPLAVAGAVVVLVVTLLLRRRAAALVAALLTVTLAAFVAPRALGGPSGAEGGDGPRLTVLTANLYGEPRAAAEIVGVVRRERPDVLSLQEVTPRVATALEDAGLRRAMPERVQDVRDGGLGSAVYARLPLRRTPAVEGQTVTTARLRMRGAPPVELLAVHARVPIREANMDEWRADLRALPAATPRGPVRILAGDFNATLDHAELRRVLDRGYEDAADEVGRGLRATWPSNRRFPPPVTIDHVLADERCGVRSLRVIEVPGSDHRAVLAVLELPRGQGARSAPPLTLQSGPLP